MRFINNTQKEIQQTLNERRICYGVQFVTKSFEVVLINYIGLSFKVGHLEYGSSGDIYENKIKKDNVPYSKGAIIEFVIKDQEIELKLNKIKIFSSKKQKKNQKLCILGIGNFKLKIVQYI